MTRNSLLTFPALLAVACLGLGCPADDRDPAILSGVTPVSESNKQKLSDQGYDLTPPTPEEKAKLVEKLTPEQVRITQKSGTEAAFCGTLLDNKKEGIYTCVVCGLPLFDSKDKFTSGTGWPSFTKTFDREHVVGKVDRTHGMVRTEIVCGRCGSHLGHVFEDGPAPTGLRFCLNSESLNFIEEGEELPPESRPVEVDEAFFAGGCFWGVEYAFSELPGVLSVTSGYQNGAMENPDYKSVCSGTTGHAESVRVRFDPDTIDYETLVRFFFRIHDPTTLNRQGPDMGTQYRSGIYTKGPEQMKVARTVLRELSDSKAFGDRTIVTEIEATQPFYEAEGYHQDYVARTGRACHPGIGEAVEEFKKKLAPSGAAG